MAIHLVKYIRPPRMQTITHIAVMQKMIYRLASDTLTPEETTRIRLIVGIYRRMYGDG